jgi:type IV secretory pathway TraG/TraD family ATPase VirD4
MSDHLSFFGRTNFRGNRRLFGIQRADRRSHMYVIGKTGTGKSTLLETLLRQDIVKGDGCAVVDPHGDLVEKLYRWLPPARRGDLVLFDPASGDGLGFNPLAAVPPSKRSLAVAGLVEVFKKTWLDSWGPRVEHLLRNALFALLEQPEATLGDVGRLLHDSSYRERAVERVTNRAVRSFWKDEYAEYSKSLRSQVVAPLENKLGAFLTDPKMRSVLAEGRQSLDLRRIMDEGKVLLVNLSKGRLGEGPAMLLGSLLVAHISLHGLARAELPEERRRDFYLYLDEFQTFATKNLTAMLSELRKYRVSLVLANQYLDQLDPEIRHAILGNVGTLISFRVGPTDARILAHEFEPEFAANDLTNLPNHEIYVRLMVDGSVSRPFSGETVKLGGASTA